MTFVNGSALLALSPIENMLDHKARHNGLSHGLTEAGYDVRVKQTLTFTPPSPTDFWCHMQMADHHQNKGSHRHAYDARARADEAFHGYVERDGKISVGRAILANTIERFNMPPRLLGLVGHKSTHARMFVNVWAGTAAEPGWSGNLTLEIVFHGNEPVTIPAGMGIAQVWFPLLAEDGDYGDGKYQNQPDRPVEAIMERG